MLWLFLADVSNISTEYDASYFSDYRKRKLEKIRIEQKRKQSIGVELLLMHGVKKLLPQVQFPLNIKCKEKGKPEFDDIPLYFSLSHSSDYAACVISDAPVGLDIECGTTYNEKIVERFFLQHEQAEVLSANNKDRAFAEVWTAKESAVKFLGDGLSRGLSSISVYDDHVILLPENTALFIKKHETKGFFAAICSEQPQTKLCVEMLELA